MTVERRADRWRVTVDIGHEPATVALIAAGPHPYNGRVIGDLASLRCDICGAQIDDERHGMVVDE